RIGFLLAAAGSAIGLGNIWKFPYITGVNGGGAFVLIYLVCIAAVGIPIFVAELFIGQRSQRNAVAAFDVVHRPGSPWRLVGLLGIVSAFLILSFYSVVGGWILDFLFKSIGNQFAGHSDQEIKGFLGSLFAAPLLQLFWHAVFMGITVGIVLKGLNAGIERWNRILMPSLFLLLLFLLIRVLFLPGFGQAIEFLFSWETSRLTAKGVLEAVGHSFFTLSLGMGAMITYGSYLQNREQLLRTALSVALLDTLIALVAGIVIFSIVFTFGLQPGAGPTLMFETLPVLFTKLSGSYLISIAFFLLVAFAALTSAISLLEVVVAYFVENRGVSRKNAALVLGLVIYALGVLSALSSNVLSGVKVTGLTFFDLFDKLTSSVFLPFGGMVISLFFGWVLGPSACTAVMGHGPKGKVLATGLLWTTRIIAPAGVLIMLINGLREW
ncbi:MAG TPA: sodium-dependent transporter, partial [Bdellovibrionales bacterium]|nr:sodium-dependent transporter [Bdellovibrionales bacterium]